MCQAASSAPHTQSNIIHISSITCLYISAITATTSFQASVMSVRAVSFTAATCGALLLTSFRDN
jgi:hypothetical protein